MNVAELIERATADGLTIQLSANNEIKVAGEKEPLAHWLPVLKERKAEIVEALNASQTFTDWIIHFDQSEKWMVFPDGVTRAEVEKLYPGAVMMVPIDPLPH